MRRASALVWASAVLVLVLPGCGGNASGNESPGSGGMLQAGGKTGSPGAGGSMSQGGSKPALGGSPGLGGNGGMCCLAEAVCKPDDVQLMPGASCPAGAECYTSEICCSKIYCAHYTAQCNAIPTCDPGDTQLSGACPPDATSCYTRTLCGSTVWCLKPACNPQTEYNRKYVATSPEKCALIDFACGVNTAGFSNDCGCGCEQDPSCPEWVDCQPRVEGTLDPMCSDKTKCPFTLRAL